MNIVLKMISDVLTITLIANSTMLLKMSKAFLETSDVGRIVKSIELKNSPERLLMSGSTMFQKRLLKKESTMYRMRLLTRESTISKMIEDMEEMMWFVKISKKQPMMIDVVMMLMFPIRKM